MPLYWRDRRTAQIGWPPRGVVLEGLTPDDRDLLTLLAAGHRIERHPVEETDAERELLGTLWRSGLLTGRPGTAPPRTPPESAAQQAQAIAWAASDASADDATRRLRDRRARRVLIVPCTGSGPGSEDGQFGPLLAGLLQRAGVGSVVLHGPPSGPATEPHDPALDPPGPCDLVVVIDRETADAAGAAGWMQRDQPHLGVVLRAASIVIGPLVVPGRGPCLRCVDLHHSDADPRWPAVLAQVDGSRRRSAGDRTALPRPVVEEPTLSALAASLAALSALTHLDGSGRPGSARARSVQVSLPHGDVHRQDWGVHPECGCDWIDAAPMTAIGAADGRMTS